MILLCSTAPSRFRTHLNHFHSFIHSFIHRRHTHGQIRLKHYYASFAGGNEMHAVTWTGIEASSGGGGGIAAPFPLSTFTLPRPREWF